jgi:hypothetical protein
VSGLVRGPALSDLAAWGLPGSLPPDPFSVEGRLRIEGGVPRVDGVVASVGPDRARVDGALGAGPDHRGLDAVVDAAGPSLAALGRFLRAAGLEAPRWLPAAAYEISGRVRRGVAGWELHDVRAKAGGSDLDGCVLLRLDGKPTVDADLRSGRLDVAGLLAGLVAKEGAGPTPTAGGEAARGERLISDRPLSLDALRSLDAKLRLRVAEVPVAGVLVRGVVVAGALRDGALRLEPVEGVGFHGGRISGRLALEPSGGGYRLAVRGRVDGVRLVDSTTAASREKAPALDVEGDLTGEGRSPHSIAASLDGRALLLVGAGQVSNAHEHITSGVLRSLLDALNPFRSSSDHTDLECGIASATVEHGKAVVEPIAARSDRMTVVGKGEIDLRTEEIELAWTLKPRTGVGISPGSIANPFVKLGGTLSSPRLEVKPLEAVASTGAAVATMGLTILAKGVYDRITAEKKVCVDKLVKPSAAKR